jgi:predicted 3-demethylubiquinone-9 3-methyltransferase (glyoxalase superfamily)
MKITTFLMFDGKAEAAMNDYIALFPDSRVHSIERYGAGQAGKEGTVKLATIELAGMRVMCIDSPVKHAFTFTPAISLFVDVDARAELDRLYAALVQDGQTLMPPNNYGFSTWFAWVQDKYGVSWQLNLP